MNLFDFENGKQKKSINVIDLRARILGLRIVWKRRNEIPAASAYENRAFIRARAKFLRGIKSEYPLEYQRAHELSISFAKL